jgi:hypothetical protein
MGYYLLDNPPRSPQFYPSRSNTPTYAVGVHTSEGPTGPGSARNLAAFIARRSDPGSYACIVDSEETIVMVPPDYTTFSVAASGYNSRTWHICLAGRSAELSPDDANTQAMIVRAGEAIRTLWTLLGIPLSNAQWIGTDALNRPGLFCHGDVQPWDRSDAWSTHPDRGQLDQQLVNAINLPTPPTPPTPTPPTPPTPTPPTPPTSEEIMRRFIRPQSSPNVYLTDAGLLGKVHMQSEQALKDAAWTLTQSGIPILPPPAGSKSENIAGVAVWVVSDPFADAIPTL